MHFEMFERARDLVWFNFLRSLIPHENMQSRFLFVVAKCVLFLKQQGHKFLGHPLTLFVTADVDFEQVPFTLLSPLVSLVCIFRFPLWIFLSVRGNLVWCFSYNVERVRDLVWCTGDVGACAGFGVVHF